MQTLAQAVQEDRLPEVPQPFVYLAGPISVSQMSADKRAELRRLVEEMTSDYPAFPYEPLH